MICYCLLLICYCLLLICYCRKTPSSTDNSPKVAAQRQRCCCSATDASRHFAGVAGLTLSGGFGWLSRKYGMKVDNLISSADVITAEGELLGASEQENEDLFWGIRGGGGNLGS